MACSHWCSTSSKYKLFFSILHTNMNQPMEHPINYLRAPDTYTCAYASGPFTVTRRFTSFKGSISNGSDTEGLYRTSCSPSAMSFMFLKTGSSGVLLICNSLVVRSRTNVMLASANWCTTFTHHTGDTKVFDMEGERYTKCFVSSCNKHILFHIKNDPPK